MFRQVNCMGTRYSERKLPKVQGALIPQKDNERGLRASLRSQSLGKALKDNYGFLPVVYLTRVRITIAHDILALYGSKKRDDAVF